MREKIWNYKQTKAIQAICIIGIVLHHLAQKTCAPWLDAALIRHGLDFFVPIGYLFVAVFLFSSGYGLLNGFLEKENYLKGFLGKHFLPIIVIFLLTEAMFEGYGGVASPYTWYIYAILYLYLLFYLLFRFCKNVKLAIVLLCLGTVGYCLYCDWLVLGGWWINTVGLFPLGFLYRYNEERMEKALRKLFWVILPLTLILLWTAFTYSEKINDTLYGMTVMEEYNKSRILVYTLQFVGGVSVVVLCLLLSTKLQLRSKILSFIGSMTLEIYLVHGFFVQLFGFSFVEEQIKPIYFIHNVWLHLLAVCVCTAVFAYLLLCIKKLVVTFQNKNEEFLGRLKKDCRVLLVGFGAIVLLGTLFCIGRGVYMASEIADLENTYSSENLSFADINGKKMAAYCIGEGEKTVVILRSENDPCPTLTMRPLANTLAEKYKVVVLDPLGSGFSDAPDTARSAENITAELHMALQALDQKEELILMPMGCAGMYAQLYAHEYKDEVCMIVGVDALSDQALRGVAERQGISLLEMIREETYLAQYNCVRGRVADYLGYDLIFWPFYKNQYGDLSMRELQPICQKKFFENIYNGYTVEEMQNLYASMQLTENMKYPGKIPVVDIVSAYDHFGKRTDMEMQIYNSQISKNALNHHVEKLDNAWRCVCTGENSIVEIIKKYDL